jgi:hypothetical protein
MSRARGENSNRALYEATPCLTPPNRPAELMSKPSPFNTKVGRRCDDCLKVFQEQCIMSKSQIKILVYLLKSVIFLRKIDYNKRFLRNNQ